MFDLECDEHKRNIAKCLRKSFSLPAQRIQSKVCERKRKTKVAVTRNIVNDFDDTKIKLISKKMESHKCIMCPR